ncbi:winged helix-turn-helix transcriptional regulator [Marivibrio halodurans]|uniref:Winged helix-turn-helix transcriptional regulator n=1 Tax=Marivibrio halodurans TaxID=2039722 RepID=A0A8J7SK85_9PROT|nr:metalloregulator ArsR/SmtB family transcription factor [Marivibrio halodurans]MBP5858278.1 winged helix-turn-helix transcriptional regulator [Marivibrio halodurans]
MRPAEQRWVEDAVAHLGALAHETRLAVVRLLVEALPDEMSAGEIAARLDVRENALSPHLDRLVRAAFLSRRREGRYLYYSADLTGLAAVMRFLLRDCCDGRPELCGPSAVAGCPSRAEEEMS